MIDRYPSGHPPAALLPDPGDASAVSVFLHERGLLGSGEGVVAAGRAGDGNMNCTLRVTTSRRRLIVKQGRPWVEKYPEIAAPRDRTLIEGRFYEVVRDVPAVAGRMPQFVGLDVESRTLVLEDCGEGLDATSVYAGGRLPDEIVDELVDYLAALDGVRVPDADRAWFENREMRALNHEHIFRYPLAGDAALHERLDTITPGLAARARALTADSAFVSRVSALGDVYLHGEPRALVHGDFFPGSWLVTPGGVRVIDPEFCFLGRREIDLGVMVAHVHLAGLPDTMAVRVLDRYRRHRGADPALVAGFAGVEIMRRLIGVAQLPLASDLPRKRGLLDLSRALVLGGPPIPEAL
jgi:5-methylthioribose kinase